MSLQKLKEKLATRNTEEINSLIAGNTSILEEQDENGINGLMYIAYHQLPECLTFAIEKKTDFTLHEAASVGLLHKVITKLSVNPTGLHTFSKDGFLPLTLACFFGHEPIVAYLLKKGAKVNIPAQNPSKVMPLHSAVARNDFNICQLLINNGAAINAQQTQGVTALHSAAHRGNLAIVKLLVENGADISLKMDDGTTALDFANKDEHQAVVDYLEAQTS